MEETKRLTVDVIIPTYKPGEKYKRLLERLQTQSYPADKIIIINTEKKYYEENKFLHLSQMELIHIKAEEFDHGGTRNAAVLKSDSDLILFLTDDAVPENDKLIENIVKAFENKNVAAAYGRQLPAFDCSIIERYTRSFNYPDQSFIKSKADMEQMGIKTFFCSNVCAAYRREVYDALGGFPTKTIFNEDMIFTAKLIRAGYSVAYVADARVIHSHNLTGIQQFHRNFDLAVSQKQNPEAFEGVKSESEGIKLVKQTAHYLWSTKHGYLIPKLVYVSGCKFLGYRFGKMYERLPKRLVVALSMNKRYWS
ncbi:MAG: glycosyltransferase family 2 protein [Lachnospiraceae bacterium]